MRILITGAAGFIGSHLFERLINLECEIIGLDCFLGDSYSPKIKLSRAKRIKELYNKEILNIDLRKDSLDNVLSGVDVIVNLAAMPGLIKSWTDFRLYIECNLLTIDRILTNSNFKANRFIQASTSSVYGKFAVGNEQTLCKPFSPYGVSKLAAENLIKAYSFNFGLQYTILRYFSVYGPNQRPDMAYSKFCNAVLNGKPITVYGDGSAKRTNTYISDCVDATIGAINSESKNMTFNICGSQQISVLEAIEIIGDELGIKPLVEFSEIRPGDQIETFGDSSLAKKELNFSEKISITQGLRIQACKAKENHSLRPRE